MNASGRKRTRVRACARKEERVQREVERGERGGTKQKRQEGRRQSERAQVKSILAGWRADLSRESRKLRIRCFSRNGRNQTLGLRVAGREEAGGPRAGSKRVGLQFQVHKRAPSCARTRAPATAPAYGARGERGEKGEVGKGVSVRGSLDDVTYDERANKK